MAHAHSKSGYLSDMKFYLYRSTTKIEMFYEQVRDPSQKRKIKWKVDIKVASRESETETDAAPNLDEKLRTVVAALEEQQLVGTIEEGKPYIKGIFPFRWGIYNDSGFRPDNEGPLVWFSGILGNTLIGLGGSSTHIEGCYGLTSTSSRSHTSALCGWLRKGLETGDRLPYHYFENSRDEMYEVAMAMNAANHYLRGPEQNLEFVAKVLTRGKDYPLHPWDNGTRGEVILATPLFVAQVDAMSEDGLDLPPHKYR